MKAKGMWCLLGIVCTLVLAGGCDSDDSLGTCDDSFKRHCSKDRLSTIHCMDGKIYETKCSTIAQDENARCVEDVVLEESGDWTDCRSNQPEKKPESIVCVHNPYGDGQDYQVDLIQNPDNNNVWEYTKTPISDGLCIRNALLNTIVYEGDETTKITDYVNLNNDVVILGCNQNKLYYRAVSFTTNDYIEYIYTLDCGNELCSEISGCLPVCEQIDDIVRLQTWPTLNTTHAAICQEMTDGHKYYIPYPNASWGGGASICYKTTQFDNPNGENCGPEFESKCLGNVAVNCRDGIQTVMDCKTGRCTVDEYPESFDNGFADDVTKRQQRAWCKSVCHANEEGTTVTKCNYISGIAAMTLDDSVSTTFKCTDEYDSDASSFTFENSGVYYTPMSFQKCDNGCNRETGLCK